MNFYLVSMVYATNANDDFSCSLLHTALALSLSLCLMFTFYLYHLNWKYIFIRTIIKNQFETNDTWYRFFTMKFKSSSNCNFIIWFAVRFTVINILTHRCIQKWKMQQITSTCPFVIKYSMKPCFTSAPRESSFAKTQFSSKSILLHHVQWGSNYSTLHIFPLTCILH